MYIDLIIIAILLFSSIIGYKKGFVIGILKGIIVLVFLYFYDTILINALTLINNPTLTKQVSDNIIIKYLILFVCFLILSLILNFIFKTFISKSILSFIDRLLGLFSHLLITYAIVCVVVLVYNKINVLIEPNSLLENSFFFSNKFTQYNFLTRWF